jgi:hypothetical protein
MTQLKRVVEPFGEVNVHPGPDGGVRVWASILMEPSREGTQTGIALDGSGSMRKLYGSDPGGGVVSSIFAKPKLENQIAPVAQQICAYLARKIDADHGTTCIYWATGPDGGQVEQVGDLSADQAATCEFKGPRDFGTGTQLLPAVQYFVDRFKDAPWGFFVFITDGELYDLDAVKQYSIKLAQDIAAGRRRPVKFVLIGLGPEVNEKQLEELDDLDTGTEVDLWDHKLAAEMRQLQDIFAEVVDRNARIADNGKILDAQGGVVRNYSDTGLPAVLRFVMPAGSSYFTLEVNGQRINQPLADNVALPPSLAPARPAMASPPPIPRSSAATPPPAVPPAAQPPPIPVAPPVAQPVVAPAASTTSPPPLAPPIPPPAPAKPKSSWDDEPGDLELEELARSIDLQFEDPSKHKADSTPDIDLDKADDDKR